MRSYYDKNFVSDLGHIRAACHLSSAGGGVPPSATEVDRIYPKLYYRKANSKISPLHVFHREGPGVGLIPPDYSTKYRRQTPPLSFGEGPGVRSLSGCVCITI